MLFKNHITTLVMYVFEWKGWKGFDEAKYIKFKGELNCNEIMIWFISDYHLNDSAIALILWEGPFTLSFLDNQNYKK